MDAREAAWIVKDAATRYPFLRGARVLRILPVAEHVGILVDELDSGAVRYAYALLVADPSSDTLLFILTSEHDDLVQGYVLGRFDEGGHSLLIGTGNWGDLAAFTDRAIALAKEHLARDRA